MKEKLTQPVVASDTHVHVLKYSKHGDIQLDERMVTIAGEGIELPLQQTTIITPTTDPSKKNLNLIIISHPLSGMK